MPSSVSPFFAVTKIGIFVPSLPDANSCFVSYAVLSTGSFAIEKRRLRSLLDVVAIDGGGLQVRYVRIEHLPLVRLSGDGRDRSDPGKIHASHTVSAQRVDLEHRVRILERVHHEVAADELHVAPSCPRLRG